MKRVFENRELDPDQQATRQRLLEAAGTAFAEHGFRNATVRDICRRAGANLAAVNYHFGDKEGLYRAVLLYAHGEMLAKYPPDGGADGRATPAQRLHAFVRAMLLRLFDHGRHGWHGKLMSREMVEPTAALDAIVEKSIRPQFRLLSGILRDLLGKRATPTVIRDCGGSIVGQCLFYHHCQSVISRLFPDRRFDAATAAQLADHVTRFSLAGLADRAAAPAKVGKRRGR